ncbi:MAG: hypothetical protein WDM77_14840 [Steroidobacteraceae bacterium]
MHGRQDDAILHAQKREDTFKRSSGAQQMAMDGLGGANGYPRGSGTKDFLDRGGLDGIVGLSAGSVGIYRIDFSSVQMRRA